MSWHCWPTWGSSGSLGGSCVGWTFAFVRHPMPGGRQRERAVGCAAGSEMGRRLHPPAFLAKPSRLPPPATACAPASCPERRGHLGHRLPDDRRSASSHHRARLPHGQDAGDGRPPAGWTNGLVCHAVGEGYIKVFSCTEPDDNAISLEVEAALAFGTTSPRGLSSFAAAATSEAPPDDNSRRLAPHTGEDLNHGRHP